MHRNDRRDLPFIGRWRLEDSETLRDLVDWPHATTRRLDHVEEAMIAEAMHVGRSDWISYSRRKDWYASADRRYLPRDFGYRPVIAAIGRLEHLGLIDHDRKKPSAKSHGYQSRFRASALLMALVPAHPILRCGPPRSPLILRDENGQPIEFRETAWTRVIARNVAEIEEALSSVRVDLGSDTPCLSRNGNFLEVINRNGDPHSVHVAHVPICRIFNDDWEHGGRFAGPPCQSWPRGIRPHITIDGEATEELDYGQTHLRMICARVGLNIEASDLFDIPGFERDLVKQVFYILINAPNLHSALSAVADKKPRWKGKYAIAAAITDAIKERFPALAPYLHTGAGLQLMRLESDIAESVLLRLARQQGVVALPVHDSFIGEAKNAPIIEEAMIDSWIQFVGTKPVVSHKQKPSVPAPFQQNVPTSGEPAPWSVLDFRLPGVPFGCGPVPLLGMAPSDMAPRVELGLITKMGVSAFFDAKRRITPLGRMAALAAKQRRCIQQEKLADLIGIHRSTLANILAGRFGASPQTAEYIAEVIAMTPAFERQPFLPGLAA
jgi:plasmid maintenance system antidote protein VapI